MTTNLLLLPGLLEDAEGFAHQVAGLREAANVVVADLTRSATMEGLARDALEQAPEGPLAIAGHSMGGYVALEIMRQAPERIAALALLNTNARPDSPESTENRRRLLALAERDFDAVINTLLARQMTAAHLSNSLLAGTIANMAHSVGKEAFARQQNAIIHRIDSRPHLAKIRCKTLVVAARDDAIMPLDALEEIAEGVPRAELVVIDDCGHMAPIEQPDAVTDALHVWLTGRPHKGPEVLAGSRRPAPT
ncbi:MAG: alpha/beta fold hydrolase [Bacillota bacterium]